MNNINIPELREEVLAILDKHHKLLTSLVVSEDKSVFKFQGKEYVCEVTLNDSWIGYDLDINTHHGMAGCGMMNDTDIYPLRDGNEEISLAIYNDMLVTLKALFSGNVYFTTNEKFSYTARKNEDGTYKVNYMERKKLLFLPYSSGWREDRYSESDFEKLRLKVLS